MGPLSMEEPGLITPNRMTREIVVVASDGQLRIAIMQALFGQVHRQNSFSMLAFIAAVDRPLSRYVTIFMS
ncbi:MAG: hypothetical protein OES79_06990 [Planctomycetota bacterium]|nr:hypothetical protein [Planctomycetota bacterium]